MRKTEIVYLDCDGTWVDLYGVENWLDDLKNKSARPYEVAKPLVNLSQLAKTIHLLQNNGIKVGVISWLAKNSNADYDNLVKEAKLKYFKKHLPSVVFDEIHIVKYGTPKSMCATSVNSVLFDDEEKNRTEWCGMAYTERDLIANMKQLVY